MARAMEVVGDRWSILILREAYYGVKRFDEFRILYRDRSQYLEHPAEEIRSMPAS